MVRIQAPVFSEDRITVEVAGLQKTAVYDVLLVGPDGAPVGERRRIEAVTRARGTAAQRDAQAVDFVLADNAPTGRYLLQVIRVEDTQQGETEVVDASRAFHFVGTSPTADDPPPAPVQLSRTALPHTNDVVLTREILRVSRARRFAAYQAQVDAALGNERRGAFSPDAYDVILRETRRFLEGVTVTIVDRRDVLDGTDPADRDPEAFLENGALPYLERVAQRYPDARGGVGSADRVADIDPTLLGQPAPVELIWTYWFEEAGGFQALNIILARFQNRRLPGGDALERLSLSYLRPLRNLLYTWGDHEIERLTVRRRAAEYQYEYGLDLIGRAVPPSLQYVERRSQFLQAFHTLLHEALVFYRLDDDTTVVADAFGVLNALRDLHHALAPGAENQFDGVALQSRIEAMAGQYVLAQPEMREFLGGRPMVPYEEPWMDRVDTLRTLFRWGDTSVISFYELAVHGEQIVMTARWGDWSDTTLSSASAANWAREMRDPVYRYVHAYRTVTGVDLHEGVDTTMPAMLLARRNRARVRA